MSCSDQVWRRQSRVPRYPDPATWRWPSVWMASGAARHTDCAWPQRRSRRAFPFPFHPHSGKCGRTFCSRSDWCRNKGYRERLADPSFASIIRTLPHQSAIVAWELLLSYVSLHISHGYISKCQCVPNRFNSSVMPPEALLGGTKFHFHVSISLFKTDNPLYQSKVLSTTIGLTRCFGERTCTWRISQSRSLLGIILLACCVHTSCFTCQQLTIVAWKPLLPCIWVWLSWVCISNLQSFL